MARPGATKYAALDAWLREHEADLRAACKLAKCEPNKAAHVLEILTKRAKPGGRCGESVEQLAQATLLKPATVKRCLDALTRAGVLVTVTRGRRGKPGGKGQPSQRVLSFMAGNATGEAALGTTNYEGALTPTWERTNGAMRAHNSETHHGLSPTGFSTTQVRAADAEPATGAHEVVETRPKPYPTLNGQEQQLCDAVAARLAEPNLKRLKHPEAWKRTVIRDGVWPQVERLQRCYALDQVAPDSTAWPELLTVLACLATDEAASDQAWAALDPYRLVRAD